LALEEASSLATFDQRSPGNGYHEKSKEDSNQPPWPVQANTLSKIQTASFLAGDFTVTHLGSLSAADYRGRFFFGDYEGFREVNGLTYSKTTLTQNEYNDVNSLNGGSPQLLLNAGNGTQGLTVDPIALAYLKLYPAPNAGAAGALSNNYITSPSRTQFSNSFDVRVDHKFNDHNLFFARYDYNKVNTFTPPGLGTNAATGLEISGGQFDFDGPATDTAQQYGFGFTHIFTQNLLVDLRAAFTRINNLSLPLNSTGTQGADAIVSGGLGTFASNLNSQSTNLTPIGFPGLSDIGDGSFVPLQDIDNNFQYLGTVSWTKGSHNIKFGASLLRRQARNVQSPYVGGQYTFGLATDSSPAPGSTVQPSATQQRDNGIASALTGAFSGEQRQVDLTAPDYRTWEPSFFVQDSWKVTPKLTVLYGVRYDLFTPFTEAHNQVGKSTPLQSFRAVSLSPFSTMGAMPDRAITTPRRILIQPRGSRSPSPMRIALCPITAVAGIAPTLSSTLVETGRRPNSSTLPPSPLSRPGKSAIRRATRSSAPTSVTWICLSSRTSQ
jgi:hypothetical protein